VLRTPGYRFKRIGLEAGPLSQWLFSALGEANLPVICVETRHMRAVLKAQINKTDRNDARGMAQMMRVGLYRPVHVKTPRSQKLRMLLTHRKLLQSKAIATASGLTALSSAGPGRLQPGEHPRRSNELAGNPSSTTRWNDVPRGTMDEVSSHVRLDLPTIGKAAH
jgi:transposase